MARTPVIFVPGLCGSFNLGVLLDWRKPTLTGWGFPPFIDYGKSFLDAFTRAGYTRDQDLFVAFYDWRKSVKDSANSYLRPWIARAKQRSGANKVILIGHSMGGLVARSYIQGSAYADDVEQLITLATPHRGSSQAYFTWGGGDLKSDPSVKVVFDVYLWYLRHAHPFATELDPVRTIRSLVPSIRDLLPIDDYLYNEGGPPVPKDEDQMVERNLVGDLLNQEAGVEALLGRVPVATVASVGFTTIKSIVVAGPPLPPGEPPRYPDGKPVSEQVDPDGDGTVMRSSAAVTHPQVENSPAIQGVGHGTVPDHPAVLARVFELLGVSAPVLGEAPVPEPRLVIMTASPVTLEVETPGGPPMVPAGVLGAAVEEGPPRRPRVIRGRDHGHTGKHLNIAVIPRPAAGTYNVRLEGTASGTFSIGALLISSEGAVVLGGGEEAVAPQPTDTLITTRYGRVAAGTRLFYAVTCHSLTDAPEVALDKQRTTGSAVARLRDAVSGPVLGASGGDDPVDLVLGAAADPAGAVDALSTVAEQAVGPTDPELAEALIVQLAAVQ